MKKLYLILKSHGTRILGVVQGTVAAVAAVDGIIPPQHLKYYLAAFAVLTYWRGQLNAQNREPPP